MSWMCGETWCKQSIPLHLHPFVTWGVVSHTSAAMGRGHRWPPSSLGPSTERETGQEVSEKPQDSHDPSPDLPNCDLDFLGPRPLRLTP